MKRSISTLTRSLLSPHFLFSPSLLTLVRFPFTNNSNDHQNHNSSQLDRQQPINQKTPFRITADDMKKLSVNVHKNRKDSKWIYSTKHQEMITGNPGSLVFYPHLPKDTHNVSLRFMHALKQAKIVITPHPQKCHALFKAIRDQIRYVEDSNPQTNETLPSVAEESPKTMIISQLTPNHTPISDVQYNSEIQISKYIELEKEGKHNEDAYKQKFSHKKFTQLKSYMQFKAIDEQITEIANEQGYPTMFSLEDDKIDYYLQLLKKGMNMMMIFEEDDIQSCGKCLKIIQDKKIGYEIFPSSDQLIKAIVTSALPADRFSLDYNPTDINLLLHRRKNMKMTIAIKLSIRRLNFLLQQIKEVYGNNQIVYIKFFVEALREYKQYRGQLQKVEEEIDSKDFEVERGQNVCVIIAPYLADFNEKLKDQLDIRSHIVGEVQSPRLNQVELVILSQKLEQYKKKDLTHDINLFLMTSQLLSRIGDREKVKRVLREVLPVSINESTIERMIELCKKQMVPDYLQLDEDK